jgi:hypothetical protein
MREVLSAVRARPSDRECHAILADACDDAGLFLWAQQLRAGPPPLGLHFLGHWYGDGYGHGGGDGDGHGGGDGHGDGDGELGGRDGDGYGGGHGGGYGKPIFLSEAGAMPEVGLNQLIVLPHAWVICGFVEEQTGPYSFRVVRASVICRTGGTPWDKLADGDGRGGATFRPWGTVTIGPQFVMAREWKGELPQ